MYPYVLLNILYIVNKGGSMPKKNIFAFFMIIAVAILVSMMIIFQPVWLFK